MRRHWTVRDSVNVKGTEADLLIYDTIDASGFYGISAKDLVPAILALDVGQINLRINSPGGDVFDGMAIYNALRAHPAHVTTYIDGLAASIASVIAMAGDDRNIAPNAFIMVHNASGLTYGPSAEHRKMAETLDKVDGAILATYTKATGKAQYKVRDWMAAETWFSADEAVAEGFADEVLDPGLAVAAAFDLSGFRNVPEAVQSQQRELAIAAGPRPSSLERALRDAGLSRAAAKAVLAEGLDAIRPPDDRAELVALASSVLATLSR